MAHNITKAHFCEDQVRTWTDELWQYDYGQILKFEGIDRPVAYEVHFANAPHGVNSTTQNLCGTVATLDIVAPQPAPEPEPNEEPIEE